MQPSTRAAIVGALRSHDQSANLGDLDDLVPLIFDELRAMARRQLSHQHDRYTLQTTELVHGAYLRLVGDDGVEVLPGGRVLVSSQADSSLHLFSGNAGHAIIHTLGPPADIAVDTKRNRVAVPVVALNHVEIYELPK